MDGTKLTADTKGNSNEFVVGRCLARVEVSMRIGMDLVGIKILVVVGSKQSENLCH